MAVRDVGCHSDLRVPPSRDSGMALPAGAGQSSRDTIGNLWVNGCILCTSVNEKGGSSWREKTPALSSESCDLGCAL